MYKQIKYELKAHGTLRLAALVSVILLNAGMALIFGSLGVLGSAGNVLSVVLSSIALAAILFIGFFLDLNAIQRLFVAPAAYLSQLTPVKPWKLIASRTLINLVQDFLFAVLGVLGLLLQIAVTEGFPNICWPTIPGEYWFGSIAVFIDFILGYWYVILTIYFAVALTRSVLAGIRGRTLLAILAACACFYLYSALNVVLLPLNSSIMYQWGPFISFTIDFGSVPGHLAMTALNALKCAALFFGACKLMERKINI